MALCEQLCRNARRYDSHMILTLLQLLGKLDLPADATILLTTLQVFEAHYYIACCILELVKLEFTAVNDLRIAIMYNAFTTSLPSCVSESNTQTNTLCLGLHKCIHYLGFLLFGP